MASVVVMTADHISALIDAVVKSIQIDGSGFLTFTLVDDTVVDVGSVIKDTDLTSAIASLTDSATIDGSNHLILHKADGVTTLDVGSFTDAFVKSAAIDGTSQHLILTLGDGSTSDLGSVNPTVPIVLVNSGLVMAAAWGSPTWGASVSGNVVTIYFTVNRTGGTITASASGNITDTLVCTLPVGIRPIRRQHVIFANSDVAAGQAQIDVDGTVKLMTMDPTSSFGSGDSISFGCTYIHA